MSIPEWVKKLLSSAEIKAWTTSGGNSSYDSSTRRSRAKVWTSEPS